MTSRFALMTAICVLLAGCANVSQTLPPTAQPEPHAGYIAGLFSRAKGANLAFVIRSKDSNAEYVMPLGEDSSLPSKVDESSVAIKVAPGTYTIVQWMTYATLTKDVISRKDMQNSPLSIPFTVVDGGVTHLGNFAVGAEASYGRVSGGHGVIFANRVRPTSSTQGQVQEVFARAYPKLAAQPFHCVFCVDTLVVQQP
jgi:hypothetical protein